MSKQVLVLMGGFSVEREVSLASGKGCVGALQRAGYEVSSLDVTRDMSALVEALQARPDVVFNALHGRFGEDGCVQGLLDMMGIPYTHSGVLASALAMDKAMSRKVLENTGLPIAPGEVLSRGELTDRGEPPRPYVVKPLNEGSSVGVELVFADDPPGLPFDEAEDARADMILVEQYIAGREIQVAVMGDRALGAIEIRTSRRFYDYEAKYEPGGSEHLMPAPIAAESYDEACELGVAAHNVMGCRGVSRVDMRYDDTQGEPGRFYLLEVNTQPGMTPTSLVPEIALHAGITFEELVTWMVENAACDA